MPYEFFGVWSFWRLGVPMIGSTVESSDPLERLQARTNAA